MVFLLRADLAETTVTSKERNLDTVVDGHAVRKQRRAYELYCEADDDTIYFSDDPDEVWLLCDDLRKAYREGRESAFAQVEKAGS